MSTILDVVNVRFNSIAAQVRAADEKVAVERDARTTETQSLRNRVSVLETDFNSMTDELVAHQAQITALVGRVDALLQQLTELGVDAEI